jgi:hypothetical protein
MVNIDLKLFILQTFDSQSEAADKLGFNECRLSRLIRRRTKPTEKDHQMLARVAGDAKARQLLGAEER